MEGGRRRSSRRTAGNINLYQPEDFRHQRDNRDNEDGGRDRQRRRIEIEDGQPQQANRGRVEDRGEAHGRQRQRNRGQARVRENSQERATGDDIPTHTQEFQRLWPHLVDIFVSSSVVEGARNNGGVRQNTQRDDTVSTAYTNRFGISDCMMLIPRLIHATLREHVNDRERLVFGLPTPLRNPDFTIPNHRLVPDTLFRWAWVNNEEICSGLGTHANANYHDFSFDQRTRDIFGLDLTYPDDDALFGCNDRTRPGKWMIRVKQPHLVASAVLGYQNRPIVNANGWSHVFRTMSMTLHTCEYAQHRRRNRRSSRRFVKCGPAVDARARAEYDPANPMETCHPNNAVTWIYHPRLVPGCNAKEFVHNRHNGEIPRHRMVGW